VSGNESELEQQLSDEQLADLRDGVETSTGPVQDDDEERPGDQFDDPFSIEDGASESADGGEDEADPAPEPPETGPGGIPTGPTVGNRGASPENQTSSSNTPSADTQSANVPEPSTAGAAVVGRFDGSPGDDTLAEIQQGTDRDVFVAERGSEALAITAEDQDAARGLLETNATINAVSELDSRTPGVDIDRNDVVRRQGGAVDLDVQSQRRVIAEREGVPTEAVALTSDGFVVDQGGSQPQPPSPDEQPLNAAPLIGGTTERQRAVTQQLPELPNRDQQRQRGERPEEFEDAGLPNDIAQSGQISDAPTFSQAAQTDRDSLGNLAAISAEVTGPASQAVREEVVNPTARIAAAATEGDIRSQEDLLQALTQDQSDVVNVDEELTPDSVPAQTVEAGLRGVGETAPLALSAPTTVATAADVGVDAAQFTGAEVASDGPIEGGIDAGQAGAKAGGAFVAQSAQAAAERPAFTAGTLVGTAGTIGAASRLSGPAGRATASAIQPLEEAASAGLTRAFPGVASRFPNNRIDNEEIVIRGAQRVGSGVRSTAQTTRDLVRGDIELDPSPRQQSLIDEGRPRSATETETGEAPTSPVQSPIDNSPPPQTLDVNAEDLPGEVVAQRDPTPAMEATPEAEQAETPPEPDGPAPVDDTALPLREDIEQAGGVRRFVRGEDSLGETILPEQIPDGLRDIAADERGQLTPAARSRPTDPEVEADTDRPGELQEQAFETSFRQRRGNEGTFDGVRDPLSSRTPGADTGARTGFERATEVETETETETGVRPETSTRPDERGDIRDSPGQRQPQRPATEPLGAELPDVGERNVAGLDGQPVSEPELETETLTETEARVDTEFETAFETAFETEAETETETEFETALETETETEFETEAFGFRDQDDDDAVEGLGVDLEGVQTVEVTFEGAETVDPDDLL